MEKIKSEIKHFIAEHKKVAVAIAILIVVLAIH